MADLFQDYLASKPELEPFFEGVPAELFTRAHRPARLDPDLLAEMRRENRAMGCRAELPEEAVFIVTGQQPGLLTGPLYSVYKAATAVILARRLETHLGMRCVPIFWVGSDDHDFEEAREVGFLGKDHEPRLLRYEPTMDVSGLPMSAVPLDPNLREAIERISTETPGFEFRELVAGVLKNTLETSRTFAEWSTRLMAWLFRETELVFFWPGMAAARRLSIPFLEREIHEPLTATTLLHEAGDRLQALGYIPQILKARQECSFFLFEEGRRRKVVFQEDAYVLPETGRRWHAAALSEHLHEHPDRFSPNVVLRCIVQQRLFAPCAYVAGPGEIAYWAQLRANFKHFGLAMPLVYPRARCTLTSIKLNKLRRRLGLDMEAFSGPQERTLERALANTVSNPSLGAIRAHRRKVEEAMAELSASLPRDDWTARSMVDRLHHRLVLELDRIERAVLMSDEAQKAAVAKQVARLYNAFMPWRRPQERVYTVFSYLFEHGPGLMARLLNELDVTSFKMNEVEL